MPLRSRRGIALGIGAGAALALGAAIVASWPALERRYHLERLRREPGLLEDLLLAEHPPRRLAAEDFLRAPAGRRELFRLYLLELDRTASGMGAKDFLLRERKDSSRRGLLTLSEDSLAYQSWTVIARSHASFSIANRPVRPDRRRRLLDLVEGLAGEVFTVPGFEGLQFQIRTTIGGSVSPPAWDGAAGSSEWLPWPEPSVPPGTRHVCYYRVTGA